MAYSQVDFVRCGTYMYMGQTDGLQLRLATYFSGGA